MERPLGRLAGVIGVNIDLDTGRVVVEFGPGQQPSEADLRQAVRESGFTLDRIEPD